MGTLCFLEEVWDVEVVENKLEDTRWDGKGWESGKKKKVGGKNKGKVGVLLGKLKRTSSDVWGGEWGTQLSLVHLGWSN